MKEFLLSPVTLCIARIVLTCFFWMAGIFGLFNFSAIVDEMTDAGLPYPVLCAVATIACQLAGSLMIIINPAGYGWAGAAALIVFTLLTIPLGHAFWTFAEPKRSEEFHIALEHITVAGGLLLSAILSVRFK